MGNSGHNNVAVGSLDVVQLSSADMNSGQSSPGSNGGDSSGAGQATGLLNGTQTTGGASQVFVVDGGVKLPGKDDGDKDSDKHHKQGHAS
jgi:hypothetical protein